MPTFRRKTWGFGHGTQLYLDDGGVLQSFPTETWSYYESIRRDREFYALLERVMPDWRERKGRLEGYGNFGDAHSRNDPT